VTVGGKKYAADRVVLNMPVQEIFSVVSERSCRKEYVNLCKNLLPTSGIFVDIALRREISGIDGLLYSANPPAYGIVTSNICKAVAPPGAQLLTMFYPTSLADVTGRRSIKKNIEELWIAIKSFFPEIEKDILWKREVALKMIDGVQVNVDQTEERRPGSTVPDVQNLYLVGDSIAAPGAGGDVGNESVLITFEKMTGKQI